MSGGLSLSDWRGGGLAIPLLAAGGLRGEAAAPKAKMLELCAAALLGEGLAASVPAAGFFVPGRIEVLGKHTDYAGGRSILAAVERGFCLLASARDDRRVTVIDAAAGEACRFELDPDLAVPVGTWFNYPMTVARRLARNFAEPPPRGADIAFASDLPRASGMSSSSAMMVATYFALAGANDLPGRKAWRDNIDSPETLAEYLGTVENGQSFRSLPGDKGVGTFGGSEDHTCMLCCRAGGLARYSYCPVRFEGAIPLPAGHTLAIASSGVVAEKTGAVREKYNRASRLAGAVAEQWRKATGRDDPHMAAVLHSGPDAAGRLREVLARLGGGAGGQGDELRKRFEHFLAESEEIIPAAGDALSRGDLDEFGRQVDRSQELTDTLLGNQVSETIYLARAARELGAAAASAFGAGFGGSVWALVPGAGAEGFLTRWSQAYHQRFPDHAGRDAFFLTGAGPGAFTISGF
jgi:galactokinase